VERKNHFSRGKERKRTKLVKRSSNIKKRTGLDFPERKKKRKRERKCFSPMSGHQGIDPIRWKREKEKGEGAFSRSRMKKKNRQEITVKGKRERSKKKRTEPACGKNLGTSGELEKHNETTFHLRGKKKAQERGKR